MTRSEYEARRRQLDEEMRAALELVKVGHQAQVQALDLLWRMSAEGAAEPAAPPAQAPPPPQAEPDPPRPRRRGAGELLDEVMEILPRLPERFTKDDIENALKEPADRATLFRLLRELEDSGWIRTETPGRGRNPTAYRQAGSAPAAGDGAETT
ncbi:MAG TPA: hypothetical protein VNM67_01865 [Thermoanaerobaculia bacterium]|jgi:CRP-like cAMP-binding protein|nr:hypothetical protein [Thermoanaerobaculia bacterium]